LIHCGIDAIESRVLADRRCNNDKRDLLPPPAACDRLGAPQDEPGSRISTNFRRATTRAPRRSSGSGWSLPGQPGRGQPCAELLLRRGYGRRPVLAHSPW